METEDSKPVAASVAASANTGKTIFDMFETDESVETMGVLLRYGEKIRVLVARAGGANKKFEKAMKTLTKPHRSTIKAIQAGTASESDSDLIEGLMQEAYAKTVVLGWEGITEKDGTSIECTPANVISLFKRIPQLWIDIRDFASNYVNYLSEDIEEVAKN